MAGKWHQFLCALFADAALASAALAQEPAKVYLEEYKAYNAALEAGDSAAAIKHGYAAWQSAEALLGDHQLTAVLAYNYGQLVLFSDAASARVALTRALELQNAGVGDLPATELNLYLAFAILQGDPENGKKRDELRSALESMESAGFDPTEDVARIWLQLALADLNNGNEEGALAGAQKAEAAVKSVAPQEYRRQAEALILQGASYLFKQKRTASDIMLANKLFVRAAKLFPVQKSLESFDPVLSTAMAWNSAAYAMLTTSEHIRDAAPETYTGSRIPLARPKEVEAVDPSKFVDFDYTQVFEENPGIDDCKVDWEKREPPDYPTKAARHGYVGAALIGYELTEDLKVHDPFILAEVPGEVFGKYALESVEGWRLSAPPYDHPWCRENVLTVFYFIFSR